MPHPELLGDLIIDPPKPVTRHNLIRLPQRHRAWSEIALHAAPHRGLTPYSGVAMKDRTRVHWALTWTGRACSHGTEQTAGGLCRLPDVAVMQATDLGNRHDPPRRGALNEPASGASLSSARWVRALWSRRNDWPGCGADGVRSERGHDRPAPTRFGGPKGFGRRRLRAMDYPAEGRPRPDAPTITFLQ